VTTPLSARYNDLVTEHAPSLNYAQQPEGCKLHVEFFPGGVTFIDRPEQLQSRRPKSATVLIVKDGLISVDQPNGRNRSRFRNLQRRHLRAAYVLHSSFLGLFLRSYLRLHFNGNRIDIFHGYTTAELEWVAKTMRIEIHRHVGDVVWLEG
jgi:hypothetical protein